MMCMVGVLWIIWGYSIGFGNDIAGLFGGYYFDTIRTVPGNEQSVPIPRTY